MSINLNTNILMALVVLTVISIGVSNYAFAETGMKITATSVIGSSTISINGQTTKATDVTIVATAPNGNVVFVDQVTPNPNGSFSTKINTSGSLWNQSGAYTITAQQGKISSLNISVDVDVKNNKVYTSSVSGSSMVDSRVYKPETPEMGLTFYSDAIEGDSAIHIVGHTSSLLNDITITVIAPNGNKIAVDQLRPDRNGDFETTIQIGQSLWKQDGDYTINAYQDITPEFNKSITVGVANGKVIPEFGSIAALILIVAIVSVIAISARSRLSLMPKF